MPMKLKAALLFASLFLILTFSSAQELNLPRKSPKAAAAYTIGYTEVSIEYSSPAVRGREIWGGVVPYGELWRAGANEATTIEFSTDVEVEGQPLPAGKYSFFLLPQKEGKWTAVFNKTWDQWGAYNYGQDQDALRVEVDAQFSKQINQENLRYEVIGQNIENGYLLLSWEKLRLYLRIKVNAMQKAMLEVTQALAAAPEEEKWRINAQAADFLLWVGQPEPAMQYVEESIRQKPSSFNYWIKARILAFQENYPEALAEVDKARKLAETNPEDHYYNDAGKEIEATIEKWKEQ